ncbi:MAG TPA: hypothetical protein VH684_14575 [Xanthobacteraceae bacterium]|jgi:hypothetical protein
MRSALVSTLVISLVIAGMPPLPSYGQGAPKPAGADATPAGPNVAMLEMLTPAVIVDTFRAFPNGGEQLSKRIADLVVKHPKLAPELANYVVKASTLTRAQKIAAERGLAAALQRLGINAADINPPPPPPELPPAAPVEEEAFDPGWLLLLAAVIGGGVACALECFHHHSTLPPPTLN